MSGAGSTGPAPGENLVCSRYRPELPRHPETHGAFRDDIVPERIPRVEISKRQNFAVVSLNGRRRRHRNSLCTACRGRDRVYQLWFIRTGAPAVSAAKFAVNDRRRAWVSVEPPASLDDVAAITVTAEPAPGSAAPTGASQLNARSWR
jgi:hypothetical protein